METTLRNVYILIGICAFLPFKVCGRVCPGGVVCSEAHECCVQGCCLSRVPSGPPRPPRGPPTQDAHFTAPMKYYLLILLSLGALVLTLAWCCKLRQQARWRRGCCWSRGSRASEADSAGSCYYPPQYSRCGSLCRATVQPAPPPYNEVTSKPDLYPTVIYLGADKGDGDLMVQYFKNYIVRPAGSLSATSTADSLSSSYFCNTANEANTIIPPPYSSAGSVEWGGGGGAPYRQALLRSVSSVTCRTPPIPQAPQNERQPPADIHKSLAHSSSVPNNRSSYPGDAHSSPRTQRAEDYEAGPCNIRNVDSSFQEDDSIQAHGQINKYFIGNSTESIDENNHLHKIVYPNTRIMNVPQKIQNTAECSCRSPNNSGYSQDSPQWYYIDENRRHFSRPGKSREYSFPDSNNSCERNTSAFNLNSLEENQFCTFMSNSAAEGMTNENISDYSNFAKNLNNFGSKEEINRMYSVGNSMTGSDISSLANLGTPDSPPRATSPTSEFKELLDKIQQLPSEEEHLKQNNEDTSNEQSNFTSDVNKAKRYFCKSRKNSLYMPLNVAPKTFYPGKVSPTSNVSFKSQFKRKSWLSRSAPTTPSSGLVPNMLTMPTASGRSSRSSKDGRADDSPLLAEQEMSGEEPEQ